MSFESYNIRFCVTLGLNEPVEDVTEFTMSVQHRPYNDAIIPYAVLLTNWGTIKRPECMTRTIPIGSLTMRIHSNEGDKSSYWIIINAHSMDNLFDDVVMYAGVVTPEHKFIPFTLLRHSPHFALGGVYVPPIAPPSNLLDQLPPITDISVDPNISARLGVINNQIVAGFSNVGIFLGGIVGALAGVANAFITGLITHATSLVNGFGTSYAEQTAKMIEDVVSGSPEWAIGLRAQTDPMTIAFTQALIEGVNVNRWLPDDPDMDAYIKATYAMNNRLIQTSVNLGVMATAIEVGSFGQVEGINQIVQRLMGQFGVDEINKTVNILPVQKGLLTPFEHSVNLAFPNEIPPYADLINMRVKEKITQATFAVNLGKLGFNAEWSSRIWEAHFQAPSYGEAVKAHYRGGLTYEELLEMLERVDLDPEFNEQVWEKNLYEIPPYTDLINIRTKEVISETQFKGFMFNQGYESVWSDRIWLAHFQPPNLNDIITAWRRKIPVTIPEVDEDTGEPKPRDVTELSLEDVRQLMELVDLDPRYNSIFATRLYRDPTIRQARYMFEQNALETTDVTEIVRRDGFEDKYIDPMTQYLTTFQERPFRTTYVSNVANAYIKDVYTLEELKKRVSDAGYQEGVVNWVVLTADVKKDIANATTVTTKKPLVSVAEIRKAFMFDNINASQVRQRLLAMRYDMVDINLIIANMETDKKRKAIAPRAVALTQTQLLNAWKEGVMNEEELRSRLSNRGLDAYEIGVLIATRKIKWGLGGE